MSRFVSTRQTRGTVFFFSAVLWLLVVRVVPAVAEGYDAPAANAADDDKPAEPAIPKKKQGKAGFKAVAENKNAQARQKITAAVRAAVQKRPPAMVADKAQVLQWQQQLLPVLINELNFVRQVCEIPREHRRKVRAAGKKSIEAAAIRMVQGQQGRQDLDQRTTSQAVQQDLGKTLKEVLPPDQFARYEQELKLRSQHRKHATIVSLVAKLEESLNLDVDQRQKITESIDSKWKEPWEAWLMISRYGDQYFPQVPDELIRPHLQEAQVQLWSEVQKIQLAGFVGVMNQPTDDVEWWDADDAPPVGPPDLQPEKVDVPAKVDARDTAAVGQVFLQALGALFQAGAKKP